MRDPVAGQREQLSEAVMLRMKLVAVAGLTALFAATCVTPVSAQTAPGAPHQPRLRPRVEITPRPLLYRRCVERLEMQYRPSGPVLYPLTYCWWVRG
jgi:hypothetical protein